ncbi:cell division protein FtsX [Amorphus sp. 3PC139-8]|uniref:cell division protein FtsX n=1 Tax=Amorphus sp. 3PC139-8 TaxID=2735676 RepID=UPI00345CCADF
MIRVRRRKTDANDPFAAEDHRDTDSGSEVGFGGSGPSPIVPSRSVAGRALVVVVAIMTFLSCLTVGLVMLVTTAAGDWQADIAREITIQIRPIEGQDMMPRLEAAVRIAEGQPGVRSARALSEADNNALLEPWLGSGLSLDALPVPRLVVVTLGDAESLDVERLRTALKADVPGASLDDHAMWTSQLATVARSVIASGMTIVVLMLTALVLTIVFATRAAIASNAQVIEVLHFVGAENGFVAREFQKHFLLKGLIGGLIGGGAALLAFLAIEVAAGSARSSTVVTQAQALLGPLSIGLPGYLVAVAIIFAVAILTAVASRVAVHRHLSGLDQR